MLVIRFKNMDSSVLAKQIISERLNPIILNLPRSERLVVHVLVELFTSLDLNLPDEFIIRLTTDGKFKKSSIQLNSKAASLYEAVEKIAQMLELQFRNLGNKRLKI